MNLLKKSLFALLALFLSTEYNMAQPRKLKSKHRRHGQQITQVPQSTHKEIAEVFTTDDQKKIAQEVKDINTQTLQEKQNVKVALQQEVIKEIADIKVDLIEAQADQPQYINADQALDIIKSKKELSHMKRSSWTNSLIVKPFTKTYRLFLRVWDPKEYAALLEKERTTLEHALNVQAFNNLLILAAALAYTERKRSFNVEHMFEKDTFYKITTQAFEGGAILAADINLSPKLLDCLHELEFWTLVYFERIEPIGPISGRSQLDVEIDALTHINKINPAVIQSIWSMNQIIKEALDLKLKNTKKGDDPHKIYDTQEIDKLCQDAAQKNNQILHNNKKSYAQYLKEWISQPKNVVKTGMVMAAIGGLYLYGSATPSWLKEYANSSIGSAKDAISRGYNTTISSVKNLWNRVRGNTELPDSKEARMDAQEQESSTDQYFIKRSKEDALDVEQERKVDIEAKNWIERMRKQSDERSAKIHAQTLLEYDLKDAFDDDQASQRSQSITDESNWDQYIHGLEQQQERKRQRQEQEDFIEYHKPITSQEPQEHPSVKIDREYIETLDPDLQEQAEFVVSSLPNQDKR